MPYIKIISLITFTFLSYMANAQKDITSLYGFQLEQYRETTVGEFGKPHQQDTHEDGTQFDIFILNPNRSVYLVFEYLQSQPDIIFTIQVTGTDATANVKFKGLHLGDAPVRIEQILGAPTEKLDIGSYGQQWNYADANYTLEINREGRLSSIKIKNTFPDVTPDTNDVPDFKDDVLPALTSLKNTDIALLLAPDVEVTSRGKLFYFDKSFDTEIKEDLGEVYAAIKLETKGLSKVKTKNTQNYEENIRMVEGMDPLHVIKINDKNCTIKEIVFKYMNGKWLIWELKAL
jgi:hypothetical protein